MGRLRNLETYRGLEWFQVRAQYSFGAGAGRFDVSRQSPSSATATEGRERSLTGTFGKTRRLEQPDGTTTEWKSGAFRAYQRRTLAADALIAGSYLAGSDSSLCRNAGETPAFNLVRLGVTDAKAQRQRVRRQRLAGIL